MVKSIWRAKHVMNQHNSVNDEIILQLNILFTTRLNYSFQRTTDRCAGILPKENSEIPIAV